LGRNDDGEYGVTAEYPEQTEHQIDKHYPKNSQIQLV